MLYRSDALPSPVPGGGGMRRSFSGAFSGDAADPCRAGGDRNHRDGRNRDEPVSGQGRHGYRGQKSETGPGRRADRGTRGRGLPAPFVEAPAADGFLAARAGNGAAPDKSRYADDGGHRSHGPGEPGRAVPPVRRERGDPDGSRLGRGTGADERYQVVQAVDAQFFHRTGAAPAVPV